MPNVVDEFAHECLAIRVSRKLKAIDVIDVLSDLCILRMIEDNKMMCRPALGMHEPHWRRDQCL
jgi:hypothetical protein